MRQSLHAVLGALAISGYVASHQPAGADEPKLRSVAASPDLQELRRELDELRRQDEIRRRKMLLLEERIRALEVTASDAQPARTWNAATPAPVKPRYMPPLTPAQADRPAPPQPDEEPVRKQPAPSRAVETVLSEEHAFFDRRFTIEPGISYSRFDRAEINLSGFLALDTIFLGNISVDEVESDIVSFDLAARWSVTNRLQLNGNIPYIYRTSNFRSGGAGGGAASLIEKRVNENARLGDVSAGINYRLISETVDWPDVVVSLTAKAPTGSDPFGVELVPVPGSQGNLSVPRELPSGNGVWTASAGFSLLKTFDPVVFFASASYFYNFEESFDDIDSAQGNQPGDVKLGDAFQFGVGMAVALNDRTSLSLSYTQRFVDETETRFDGQNFVEVLGSDANVAVLNTGVTFALTDQFAIVFNVGAGLTTDAPDVTVSMRTPYSF